MWIGSHYLIAETFYFFVLSPLRPQLEVQEFSYLDCLELLYIYIAVVRVRFRHCVCGFVSECVLHKGAHSCGT